MQIHPQISILQIIVFKNNCFFLFFIFYPIYLAIQRHDSWDELNININRPPNQVIIGINEVPAPILNNNNQNNINLLPNNNNVAQSSNQKNILLEYFYNMFLMHLIAIFFLTYILYETSMYLIFSFLFVQDGFDSLMILTKMFFFLKKKVKNNSFSKKRSSYWVLLMEKALNFFVKVNFFINVLKIFS